MKDLYKVKYTITNTKLVDADSEEEIQDILESDIECDGTISIDSVELIESAQERYESDKYDEIRNDKL